MYVNRRPFWLALFLFNAGLCLSTVRSEEAMSVREAYEFLMSPEAQYPRETSPKDRAAVSVLSQNLEQTKEILISALSKRGKVERNTTALLMLFPRETALEIARSVQASFEIDDLETPLLALIVNYGEATDMERVKKLFAAHSDSKGVAGLAVGIAQSENIHAHAALIEMRKTVPGKWQESFDVKKLFAIKDGKWPPRSPDEYIKLDLAAAPQSAPPVSGNASANSGAPTATARNSPTVGHANQATPTPLDGNAKWLWVAAIAVTSIVLVFVVRRSR